MSRSTDRAPKHGQDWGGDGARRGIGPLPSDRSVLLLTPQASITDPLVQFAVDVVDKAGLPGIFALMVAESACIPIPSEATMLFAGFNVAEGRMSLAAVVFVGVIANVVGSWIAYAIGYYGRIDVLEKHGA